MNSNILSHIWRFFGLSLIQGLLLKQLSVQAGAWFNILLYPLFILLLPMALATPYLVIFGFAIGMVVDFFYQSPGVHASAGAFSGFIRPIVLAAFAPKGGFSGKEPIFSPYHFRWQTFLSVAATFFFFHLFWYFSVDAFTFVYFGTITLKTLAGWILSMLILILYMVLFNPKN